MTSVGLDIYVTSTFHSLIRHGGRDGCRMRSRKSYINKGTIVFLLLNCNLVLFKLIVLLITTIRICLTLDDREAYVLHSVRYV